MSPVVAAPVGAVSLEPTKPTWSNASVVGMMYRTGELLGKEESLDEADHSVVVSKPLVETKIVKRSKKVGKEGLTSHIASNGQPAGDLEADPRKSCSFGQLLSNR